MMNLEAALAEWRNLLAPQNVVVGDAVQAAYGADTGGATRVIPAALRVQSAEQVPEIMRIASRHRTPVYPISTGHNWGYGSALPVQDGCVIIDLSQVNRILHFDAELGVVTVEPGVTQGMLAAFLDAGGHAYMVPVTGAGPTCSLVGNALERGYGITPHADHFAAVTDLEAVLADGTPYRTLLRELAGDDLARLFKWGIGPYTAGLFTQSGFGVVTRMTIVLARRPQCVKVGLFNIADETLLEPAVARIRQLLSSLPGIIGGINLMNRHRVLAMSAPYPASDLDSQGLIPPHLISEMGKRFQVAAWTGFITLYGTRGIVRLAQREIRRTLAGVGTRLLFFSPEAAARLSNFVDSLPDSLGRRLRSTTKTLADSLQLVAGRPNVTALRLAYWQQEQPTRTTTANPARDGCGLLWYAPLVPMRCDAVGSLVRMVGNTTRIHGIEPLITLTSLSDRVFDGTVPLLFDRENPLALERAGLCLERLIASSRELGCMPYRLGSAHMQHQIARVSTFRELLTRIKHAADPDGILAPGRYE